MFPIKVMVMHAWKQAHLRDDITRRKCNSTYYLCNPLQIGALALCMVKPSYSIAEFLIILKEKKHKTESAPACIYKIVYSSKEVTSFAPVNIFLILK